MTAYIDREATSSLENVRRNMLIDRKSTRLNSSHLVISYAVFCLKKKRHECRMRPSEPRRHPSHACRYSYPSCTLYRHAALALFVPSAVRQHESCKSRLHRHFPHL